MTGTGGSPLVVDTRHLVRRPGTMVEQVLDVASPSRIGTDVVAVDEGGAIHVDLRLESVLEGVLASGTVRATACASCVRCLEDLDEPVEADFTELFAYPDRADHHRDTGADDDEERVLDGDLLDLEPVIVDAVVPTLPFRPTCGDDACPHLRKLEGDVVFDPDPDPEDAPVDPRWAALTKLVGSSAPRGEGDDGASDGGVK